METDSSQLDFSDDGDLPSTVPAPVIFKMGPDDRKPVSFDERFATSWAVGVLPAVPGHVSYVDELGALGDG